MDAAVRADEVERELAAARTPPRERESPAHRLAYDGPHPTATPDRLLHHQTNSLPALTSLFSPHPGLVITFCVRWVCLIGRRRLPSLRLAHPSPRPGQSRDSSTSRHLNSSRARDLRSRLPSSRIRRTRTKEEEASTASVGALSTTREGDHPGTSTSDLRQGTRTTTHQGTAPNQTGTG